MDKPKFQIGEYVWVSGKNLKRKEYQIVDRYFDKKKNEYKYLILSVELPVTKKERHEHKIIPK